MSIESTIAIVLALALIIWWVWYNTIPNRFRRLNQRWKRDTHYVSSGTQIIGHPAYQAIIALGPEAIPLILHELKNGVGHWSYALEQLSSRTDIVPPEDRGNLEAVRAAWLAWGRELGFIS